MNAAFPELILIVLRCLYTQETAISVSYKFLTLNMSPCNAAVAAEHS